MIEQRIAEVLQRWSKVICERVKARWGYITHLEGDPQMIASLPEIVGSTIAISLEGSGMKAWIAEFGSGSAMDTTNPYLDEYMSSPMWNRRRSKGDPSFRGRVAGDTVYKPDGTTYESSGKAAGLNLEWGLKYTGYETPFTPTAPMHIIRDEVTLALPEIEADIQVAMREHVLSILTMDIQIYV